MRNKIEFLRLTIFGRVRKSSVSCFDRRSRCLPAKDLLALFGDSPVAIVSEKDILYGIINQH